MGMLRKGIGGSEIWLATAIESQKVHDIEHESHCGLSFHGSERDSTYLSLSGTAEIVRDREKIRLLWEPSLHAWFPQDTGVEDIALIRFVPEHAEYVHPETGRLQVLFTKVRNLVTGTRTEPAPKKELVLH
jgi:general stress protein 26